MVEGNTIGLDAGGTVAVGNQGHGVYLLNGSSGNTIGGTIAGQENMIAHNELDGLYLSSGSGNAILSNVIHSNVRLGIDLGIVTN